MTPFWKLSRKSGKKTNGLKDDFFTKKLIFSKDFLFVKFFVKFEFFWFLANLDPKTSKMSHVSDHWLFRGFTVWNVVLWTFLSRLENMKCFSLIWLTQGHQNFWKEFLPNLCDVRNSSGVTFELTSLLQEVVNVFESKFWASFWDQVLLLEELKDVDRLEIKP